MVSKLILLKIENSVARLKWFVNVRFVIEICKHDSTVSQRVYSSAMVLFLNKVSTCVNLFLHVSLSTFIRRSHSTWSWERSHCFHTVVISL